MSEQAECTCIYGLDEFGRQDLLEQQPYCPRHDAESYELREAMAYEGYAIARGSGPRWEDLGDDNRNLWRSWAECELWLKI